MSKGYTTVATVASFLGRPLSTAQQSFAEGWLPSVEDLIETLARDQWGIVTYTDEFYDLANVRTQLILNFRPVESLTSIGIRSYSVGDTLQALVAGTDYELIDPVRGLVVLAAAYGTGGAGTPGSAGFNEAGQLLDTSANQGMFALVTYSAGIPVPPALGQAATEILAHWLRYSIDPTRFGLKAFNYGNELQQTLNSTAISSLIPPGTLAVITARKKLFF